MPVIEGNGVVKGEVTVNVCWWWVMVLSVGCKGGRNVFMLEEVGEIVCFTINVKAVANSGAVFVCEGITFGSWMVQRVGVWVGWVSGWWCCGAWHSL